MFGFLQFVAVKIDYGFPLGSYLHVLYLLFCLTKTFMCHISQKRKIRRGKKSFYVLELAISHTTSFISSVLLFNILYIYFGFLQWSCSGPLLEILLSNFLLCANMTQNSMESAVACDLQVNYNNIQKVYLARNLHYCCIL